MLGRRESTPSPLAAGCGLASGAECRRAEGPSSAGSAPSALRSERGMTSCSACALPTWSRWPLGCVLATLPTARRQPPTSRCATSPAATSSPTPKPPSCERASSGRRCTSRTTGSSLGCAAPSGRPSEQIGECGVSRATTTPRRRPNRLHRRKWTRQRSNPTLRTRLRPLRFRLPTRRRLWRRHGYRVRPPRPGRQRRRDCLRRLNGARRVAVSHGPNGITAAGRVDGCGGVKLVRGGPRRELCVCGCRT